MEKRRLGQSQIHTSPLCLGGNVFGWTLDEAASFRILDEFVAAGFDFIDTADVYSTWVPGHVGGESESVIGRWLRLRGNRSKIILATKVGWLMPPDGKGLSRAYILRAVEDSLRRLQTDYIDLYQAHVDDADTPLAETLGAFGELIRQGKVRTVGASNYSAARLSAALDLAHRQGLPRYECLQPLYNLYDRAEYEKELAPLCVQHDVGVISYFSLASGFLTGKYRSQQDLAGRARGQRVGEQYLNPRGTAILSALDAVAAAHASTPASVALAWLMTRPGVTAPIASATSIEQLKALVAAASLKLDAAQIEHLEQASR
ncbi:MAG TPA: aldo/keto reductase [Steroidobacteraceae bacterium]|jgi:aryl-alcohol dehydrogenase-like predicted oxidoreductase|nr:aldo/keto reductase [Steroidobacteraceae bacterium]